MYLFCELQFSTSKWYASAKNSQSIGSAAKFPSVVSHSFSLPRQSVMDHVYLCWSKHYSTMDVNYDTMVNKCYRDENYNWKFAHLKGNMDLGKKKEPYINSEYILWKRQDLHYQVGCLFRWFCDLFYNSDKDNSHRIILTPSPWAQYPYLL